MDVYFGVLKEGPGDWIHSKFETTHLGESDGVWKAFGL